MILNAPLTPTGLHAYGDPGLLQLRFVGERWHLVRKDGRRIPGITTVMADMGLTDSWVTDEWYRRRGQAVHYATEVFDKVCDPDDPFIPAAWDSIILPYVQAYREFRLDLPATVVGREVTVTDRDATIQARLDGVYRPSYAGQPIAVEIKTGSLPKGAELQTGTQIANWNEWTFDAASPLAGYPLARRYVLVLKDTGSYKLIEHAGSYGLDWNRAKNATLAWHEKYGGRDERFG